MAAAAAAAGAPPGDAGRRSWNPNKHYPYYDSDDVLLGYWVHHSKLNREQRQRLDTRREWHPIPLEGYQKIFKGSEYGKSGKQKEDAGYAPYEGSGKGARPAAGTASWDWPPPPAPPPVTPTAADAKGSDKGKASSSKGSSQYENDDDWYARGQHIQRQWRHADRGWEPPKGKGKSTGKSKGSSGWQQYRGNQKGGW